MTRQIGGFSLEGRHFIVDDVTRFVRERLAT
jgi:hypothetical protein